MITDDKQCQTKETEPKENGDQGMNLEEQMIWLIL